MLIYASWFTQMFLKIAKNAFLWLMLLFVSLQSFLQMCDDRNAKMKPNHLLFWCQSRLMSVNYSPRVCFRWKTQTKGCLATVHFRWHGTQQIGVWLFYWINVSMFYFFKILFYWFESLNLQVKWIHEITDESFVFIVLTWCFNTKYWRSMNWGLGVCLTSATYDILKNTTLWQMV